MRIQIHKHTATVVGLKVSPTKSVKAVVALMKELNLGLNVLTDEIKGPHLYYSFNYRDEGLTQQQVRQAWNKVVAQGGEK